MVDTITPVVYGRHSRYVTALVAHTLAATATAGVTGAGLGLIGSVTGAPWGRIGLVAIAVVAALYAARETFRLPIPLPNARRQVPEWWRTFYPPPVAAGLYGAGLGIAFLTFLSYGTFAAVAAAAVVSGDPVTGALLFAPFGLARAISVGLVGVGVADPGARAGALAHLGGTGVPRYVNAATLILIGASAVAGLKL